MIPNIKNPTAFPLSEQMQCHYTTYSLYVKWGNCIDIYKHSINMGNSFNTLGIYFGVILFILSNNFI